MSTATTTAQALGEAAALPSATKTEAKNTRHAKNTGRHAMQTTEQQALKASIFGERAAYIVALQVTADVMRCIDIASRAFDRLTHREQQPFVEQRDALLLVKDELQRIYDTATTLDDVDGPAWWSCQSVAALVERTIAADGMACGVALMRGINAQMLAGMELWQGVGALGEQMQHQPHQEEVAHA